MKPELTLTLLLVRTVWKTDFEERLATGAAGRPSNAIYPHPGAKKEEARNLRASEPCACAH